MKQITLFLCFWGMSFSLVAQPFQKVFDKDLSPNFFDYFLSSGQKEFYLSPNGQSFFFTSDLRYTLLSGQNGEVIAEGTHVKKVNAGAASFLGILQNRSLNREDAIEKVRFDEGVEYMVFEEEEVVVIMDWNRTTNIVRALDLKTGEIKWETDRYRYSSSSKAQMLDLILGMANAGRLQRSSPRDIAVANAKLRGYGEQAFTGNTASPAAYGFMVPLSGGQFMLRTRENYVCLDLQTGRENWVYDKRKLNIGFGATTEDGNFVIVNFSSSYFKANERLIIKLDVKTGDEIWTSEHISDFRGGRTYLQGNRLICDYYGAEVFDMENGERVLLSLDERVINTQNGMTRAFMSDASGSRGTQSIASPSVIQGKFLYTSSFKLGKRFFANDGSSKAIVQKYDLESGKLLWVSPKLGAGTDLSYASDQHVFVRKGKALGKSTLFVLDASTGEELTETESIEGFIYREGAGDILTDQYLFRGGKKRIYAFEKTDWKPQKEFDIKSSNIGRLDAMIPSGNQLTAIGTKGLVFFNASEKAERAVQTPPIVATYWSDTHAFVFTSQNIQAIDLEQQRLDGELPIGMEEEPTILLSETGATMMVIKEKRYLQGYQNR